MEGGDDHQRDLHREEDGDDDYQHHGGVVGFPLSLVVSAATGEEISINPPIEPSLLSRELSFIVFSDIISLRELVCDSPDLP